MTHISAKYHTHCASNTVLGISSIIDVVHMKPMRTDPCHDIQSSFHHVAFIISKTFPVTISSPSY